MNQTTQTELMPSTIFRALYRPSKKVECVRLFKKLYYSYNTLEDATDALKEMSKIIYYNALPLNLTLESSVSNHIIIVKPKQ